MKPKNTKAVYSIKDIIDVLQLSRARYYQLLKAEILPQPLYDMRTKRPFYNVELYQQCLEVKETCLGVNGQYILFYTPRKKPQINAGKPSKKNGTLCQEFVGMLTGMGLDVSGKEVQAALKEVYPGGIDGEDQGIVVRELFRFFKRKGV